MMLHRRTSRCIAAILLLAAPALQAQLSPADALRIDSVFTPYNRTTGPGCAVGIYRNGQIAFTRGYGMADLNQRTAIGPTTVFYIASTSKQFAAASLQLLVSEGKVSLDDPVRKYVPELPAYADVITLRHLLHHQSGIRDYLGLWGLGGRSFGDEIPEEAALDLIVRQQALDFAPGSRFSYSNSGYFLISLVVKRASGQSLPDYARPHIFEPLGMRNTHFHDDRTQIVPQRAEGYEPDGKGAYRIVRTSFALVGDGGLYTTVEDLAKWDENFFANRLAGGGPAFIDRLYVRGILTNGDTTDYASGLFHAVHRGVPVITHGGSFIGFRAELLRVPSQHTSVSVLCNDYSAATEVMAKRVADVVLAESFTAAATGGGTPASSPPTVVAGATLDRYAGRYEITPGLVATVERKGDALQLGVAGMSLALAARTDSTFVTDALSGTLEFRTIPGGRFGLLASFAGMDAPAPPLAAAPVLTAAERAGVVGRYRSDELLATYVVRDEGGKLQMRAGYADWVPLEPMAPGEFLAPPGKVTVTRDRSGTVTAMAFSASRMRNIRLVRVR